MAVNTDFKNMADLLAHYDRQATPFFEVWEGKQFKFDSRDFADSEDIEGAKGLLSETLEAIMQNGSQAQYTIKFYTGIAEEKNQDKGYFKILKGSSTFKLITDSDRQYLPFMQEKINGGSGLSYELRELKEIVKAQQDQITALLGDPDEEPGEAMGGNNVILTALHPLLQNEQVQQAIAGKIISFLDSIITTKPMQTEQARPSMGNLTQTDADKINSSLQTLITAGMKADDFVKLAAIAINDPNGFNFYLNYLRK